MHNKKIVIAGGSGFIGMQMAERWATENNVVILTRNNPDSANNSYGRTQDVANVLYAQWDGKTIGPWAQELEGCDLLINLAGRSVNCRYTDENKAEILNSRVDATKVLGVAVSKLQNPPALWINSSSSTIYRHAEDRPQDEFTGEIQDDFSVQVCKAWEQAFNSVQLPATRQVILRVAIVLGHGGVLVPYSRLARFGLGGRQGSGKQMFSWIHIEDLCRILEWVSEHSEATGVFNAAAPGPIPNQEFMSLLRRHYHMPIGLPAPKWLLKLAARVVGTETELLLKSRWVLPSRLLKMGFKFSYTALGGALKNVL